MINLILKLFRSNKEPEINTAFIFAAGFGKRMLPMTAHTAKPLVRILGKPIIQYAIDNLSKHRIAKIIANTHHLANQVETYLNNCPHHGMQIIISREEKILETAGGIVKALPLIGTDPFFTINGDIIWLDENSSAISKLRSAWDSKIMDILMLLIPIEKAIGYEGNGDFNIKTDGSIFRNKTSNNYVYGGIQIIKPSIFKKYKEEPFSLRTIYDSYKKENNTYPRIYGVVYDSSWLHIGTIEGLHLAEGFIGQV